MDHLVHMFYCVVCEILIDEIERVFCNRYAVIFKFCADHSRKLRIPSFRCLRGMGTFIGSLQPPEDGVEMKMKEI